MKSFKSPIRICCLLLLITLLQGCLSVARISDFPTTSSTIDFDKYSKDISGNKESIYTFKSTDEYYLEIPKLLREEYLVRIISNSLKNNGYTIFIADIDNRYVIGKRGLRANEWNSRTGVYYKINEAEGKTQIYIKSKITQDITGGWKRNMATEIGQTLKIRL